MCLERLEARPLGEGSSTWTPAPPSPPRSIRGSSQLAGLPNGMDLLATGVVALARLGAWGSQLDAFHRLSSLWRPRRVALHGPVDAESSEAVRSPQSTCAAIPSLCRHRCLSLLQLARIMARVLLVSAALLSAAQALTITEPSESVSWQQKAAANKVVWTTEADDPAVFGT